MKKKSKSESRSRERLDRDLRREKIAEAALRTFSRHGFRGATTRQLAQDARITEVTLFRHFPTKEKLFEAVIGKYSILPVLQAELMKSAGEKDVHALLRRLGKRLLEILRERRDLIRLMFSEAVTNPRTARMLFRHGPGRMMETMARMLQGFQKRGEIRRVDTSVAARAVLGVFFSFILMQEIVFYKEVEPIELRRAAGQLSDILWRGLRSDAPARGLLRRQNAAPRNDGEGRRGAKRL